MKTKTLLALFVGVLAALAIAQAPGNYTAAEAAKHVGETVTVTDRVDGVHQSGKGNIFLNMGGNESSFHRFYPFSERRAVFESAAIRRSNGGRVWQDHSVPGQA